MAKRFKLRFSKVIPSFLLCRSKNPNRLHINPVPVVHQLSPLNRKSFDISHTHFPIPPPSTPISFDSPDFCGGGESNDGNMSSTSPLLAKKRVGTRKGANLNFVVRSRTRMSSSSGDSGWFSSDESEALVPSINFSNEHVDSKSAKLKRKVATFGDKVSTFRLKSWMQSIAVEKKSDDPFRDFKNSMMEMLLEKEMFDMRDLEDLLQCFLTLNSRHHHKVIVEAFMEIWEALFSKSQLKCV